jgi:hypothetical protein
MGKGVTAPRDVINAEAAELAAWMVSLAESVRSRVWLMTMAKVSADDTL